MMWRIPPQCRSSFVPAAPHLLRDHQKKPGATIMRILLMMFLGSVLGTTVQAAETTPLAEVFVCTLQPGKTMADVDAKILSWQKDFGSQPAFKDYFAAVWTPLRANTPRDLLWIGVTDNLNEWAALAAGLCAASEAHFADVVACESALHFVSTLHEGLVIEPGDDDGIIESYSCTLRDGKTLADLAPAHDAYAKAVDALKRMDPKLAAFQSYQFQPWLATTPFDTYYVTANDDL